MTTASKTVGEEKNAPKFFDGFTRTVLAVLFVLLLAVFASGKYMAQHNMNGEGTDGIVNDLAATVQHGDHHPFIELPGDAEVGAFSIANFFAGLIVGYHWLKLFGPSASGSSRKEEKDED